MDPPYDEVLVTGMGGSHWLRLGALALIVAACKSEAPAGGGGPKDAGDAGHHRSDRGIDESEGGSGDTANVGSDSGFGADSGGCGLVTCQSSHSQCGLIGDGCGNVINCGYCTAPETCGGGDAPNTCGGNNGCHPRTCAQAGASCGPVSDLCGGLLQCGSCSAPEVCGAGGPSACGVPGSGDGGTGCIPKTCASLGIQCGQAGDGCGNVLNCGSCAAPTTCGGGGTPSVCGGMSQCVPATCASLGATCGMVSDGCGNLISCGTCNAPATCGGGGTPNTCGVYSPDAGPSCVPRTCASVGANCGPIGDGCGGTLDCGTCAAPDICGGGGTASVCGSSQIMCTPRTCAQAGATCGPVADGCGGVLMCGSCTAPQICGGGGVPSVCGGGGPPPCTNLCLQQVTCDGGTTSISGTVYAPTPPMFGTPDPLYNALVYVPNGPVQPFPPGVSCDRCGAPASGAPLVSTITGPDGTFTLTNMPAGTNIPVVIQLGRWRRQITVANVPACQNTALTAEQTRLPRNHTEGDIPLMAMVTGNVDTLECVLEKIGIDQSEFSIPSYQNGTGRVQFFIANGSDVAPGAPNERNLWGTGTSNRLATYDMVLFACEGMPNTEMAASQRNVIDYTNLGGRVFATHYSYSWLYNVQPFQGTANWNVDQRPFPPDPQTGILDESFPKGLAFGQWIQNVGAASAPGQIQIHSPRHDLDGVIAPAQRWIYTNPPPPSRNVASIQHYTFNTPVGTPPDQQCGRVLYSDFHVANITSSSQFMFPDECTPDPLTPQEKILEFMLFDLASCIQPDMPPPPMCVPRTCAQINANCGPAGDGCGGQLDCGMCTAPQTCGGGGMPSRCGGMACTPRTCAEQAISCGPAGDGCGGQLDCGSCTAPDTCGGGGTPGACGHRTTDGGGMCVPETCASQHLSCGPAGDGCGNLIQCGSCTPPDTCGGGGTHGVCGHASCTPRTCAQAGANCGPVADGCGSVIDCGMCMSPQTCGGGGIPSVCGGACVPITCAQQHLSCGPAGDGCGGLIDCGSCTPPQTCGGGGPGVCGGNNNCMPTTCSEQGANCGPISDGCGNILDCGSCPAGSVCGANGHPNQCGVRA